MVLGSFKVLNTCLGSSSGSASITAYGGTGVYTYQWSNSQTQQMATGLSAGNYTVTIIDNNGCTKTNSVVISVSPPIVMAVSSTSTICGMNNGSASVTVSSGAGPYTYSWAPNGNLTSQNTNLTAGSYTLSVTDINGCSKTATFNIGSSSTSASATFTKPLKDTICAGTTFNFIHTGSSGNSYSLWQLICYNPFTWLTNNSVNCSYTFTSAGTYYINHTVVNGGCPDTKAITLVVINCASPTVTASGSTVCAGSCAVVNASGTGGLSPYTYSWNTGATTGSINPCPTVSTSYTVKITDASGATGTASAFVTVSPAINVVASNTNVSCNGGTNGIVVASASGGISPYTYSWSSGQSSQAVSGLAQGSYTVKVTDSKGCSRTLVTVLTEPSVLVATVISSTNTSCGSNNGSATANANGGMSGYTFLWSNGNTNQAATGLGAGNYTVTITDSNGCTAIATVAIANTSGGLASISTSNNVSCFGGNNGSASATMTGGVSPYTYSWSNGATTFNIQNLTSSIYTVTVTDINGCSSTQTVSITQPSQLAVAVGNSSATCGQNNGIASLTVSGGTGAYSYSWSNGATTKNIGGLFSGIYSVTVTDQYGCTQAAIANVNNSGGGVASVNLSTNVLCFGGNNGSASATMTGGVSPYTYSWSNGATTFNIQNLASSIYTVTVTDINGCSSVQTVSITQPSQMLVAAGSSSATCGQNNGSVSISASGGTGAYTYLWSNAATTQSVSGLFSGNYSVTVTDQNGCTQTGLVNVGNNSGGVASISTFTNVSCFGANDGSAIATMTGGVSPYTYSWSNGGTTSSIINQPSNIYTVTITDINGCSSTQAVSITQPVQLVVAVGSGSATCGQSNGAASATVSGGTGAYTYSWSNGATTQSVSNLLSGNFTVSVTDGNACTKTALVNVGNSSGGVASISSFTNVSCFGGSNGSASATMTGGSSPYTYSWSNGATTQQLNNITVGNYTITITDNAGCSSTQSVSISQPSQLSLAVSSGSSTCGQNNGSASVTASGGTGAYTYSWNNGATQSQISNLASQIYSVTITDNNGCSASQTVTVGGNVLPKVDFTLTDSVGCSLVCVQFNALGNGTSFTWNFGDNSKGNSSNPKHCYTKPGTYDVTLTISDINGCINTITKKAKVTVYPSPTADFTADPQPTTIVDPVIHFTDLSIGAVSWLWNFGEQGSTSSLQNPVYAYKDTGCYLAQLSISNQYGCKDTVEKRVCIRGEYTFYAPNAFTPDGDGLNDLFFPKGTGIDPEHYELMLFDRWGNLIWQTKVWGEGWDGRANGGKEIAQQDVYVWRCNTREMETKRLHKYIGHVTLVR